MDFNEKFFEKAKIKAPDNFVKNTMDYIQKAEDKKERGLEKKANPFNITIYQRLGKALVTAAVLIMIFNVLPIIYPDAMIEQNYQFPNVHSYIEEKRDNDLFIIDTHEISSVYKDLKEKVTNSFTKGGKNE